MAGRREMVVGDIVLEKDRLLLYPGPPSEATYHVIASPGQFGKVSVGDTIRYEPYGANFGWYIEED